MNLSILPQNLLEPYKSKVAVLLLEEYRNLKESELSIHDFNFYVSVSAVFSSKIEGENIELDSYVKHKRFGIEFQPDYTQKTDDLYNAYIFAQNNELNRKTVFEAHKMLSEHLLPQNKQGKARNTNMFVITDDGKIEYAAIQPEHLEKELEKFFIDLEVLLKSDLDIQEVFYFASLLHLVFVKIHPFDDGNGRTSRLLEKWFLTEKLGKKAWFIQSEKKYYENHNDYYNNLRTLGLEYDFLEYQKSLPFLLMLPETLNIKK